VRIRVLTGVIDLPYFTRRLLPLPDVDVNVFYGSVTDSRGGDLLQSRHLLSKPYLRNLPRGLLLPGWSYQQPPIEHALPRKFLFLLYGGRFSRYVQALPSWILFLTGGLTVHAHAVHHALPHLGIVFGGVALQHRHPLRHAGAAFSNLFLLSVLLAHLYIV
jgi:hypothetical protein